MNSMAWAENYYKVTYFIPDFERFGCLPSWFPTTDRQDRELTDQGQVDRFLYLVDLAYGGLPDDHKEVDAKYLAQAIIELDENLVDYASIEEDDEMEWQLANGDNLNHE